MFPHYPQHMALLFSSRTVFTCGLGAQWRAKTCYGRDVNMELLFRGQNNVILSKWRCILVTHARTHTQTHTHTLLYCVSFIFIGALVAQGTLLCGMVLISSHNKCRGVGIKLMITPITINPQIHIYFWRSRHPFHRDGSFEYPQYALVEKWFRLK